MLFGDRDIKFSTVHGDRRLFWDKIPPRGVDMMNDTAYSCLVWKGGGARLLSCYYIQFLSSSSKWIGEVVFK